MIIPDKKKMATMIVAQMHEPEEESEGDSHEALASEVIAAVKSGSAADLAEALKAFVAACQDYED